MKGPAWVRIHQDGRDEPVYNGSDEAFARDWLRRIAPRGSYELRISPAGTVHKTDVERFEVTRSSAGTRAVALVLASFEGCEASA